MKETWTCQYCGEKRVTQDPPSDADENWYDWHENNMRCIKW